MTEQEARERPEPDVEPGETVMEVPEEPRRPSPVWDPKTGRWVTDAEPAAPTPPAPAREPSPTARAAIVGGLVGALVASAAFFGLDRLRDQPVVRPVERRLAQTTEGAPDESGVVAIAAQARPWVVNVAVSGSTQGFFGAQRFEGNGSGVIIRSDGYVITNAHVVSRASDVEVTLASGETLPAKVVGVDTDTDVAVVKVNRELPPAVVGSASELKVGALAVAIGSPLGLRQTVTAGIISALGRTVARDEQPPLVDMIQTDAAVTQGNSGGALIDGRGALVGINTAIAASPEVGAEGIAFAIPIDIAKAIADELIATGKATHPWLGISGGNIDSETSKQFGVSEGAAVAEVLDDSPAAKAGIRPGDVIVSFGGRKIDSMDELIVAIRQHKVAEEVEAVVVRDGQRLTLRVTLGDRPERVQ